MNGRVALKAALFQIMRFVGSSEEAKRNFHEIRRIWLKMMDMGEKTPSFNLPNLKSCHLSVKMRA
jgi:hypothetical protein